ncbi:MAG: non-ribosomal peptide synthetase, partial [Acidobacteriales bacterium]|nr:non-ribosomal peptide synthetase [Terriglobales bacterium]
MPLREFLASQLPDYMVPSAYVELASLPQTLTAKLDVSALPAPSFTAAPARKVTPRDALERRLANIWESILGVKDVGITDDFFHCGGHSVLGAALFARVEKEFGKRLPLTALFEAPTIEKMAALLRRGERETPWVFPIQSGDPAMTPLIFVHAAEGYVHLANALGPEYPVYVVQYDNLFDQSTERSFQEICDELCARIQQVQPVGPYILGGACLAGLVAFEIARSLERQGEETALVAIIDSFSPGHIVEPAQPGR